MNVSIRNQPIRCLTLLLLVGAVSLGVVLCLQPARQAHGEPRRTTQQRVFKTSTERTEHLLAEIAGTLKRIDQRLERLEQVAENVNNQQPNSRAR